MENEIEVKDSVLADLKAIEAAHDVTVIHAIESGSRSWGFPSPDSDYDVRFIYVHKKDWYLQVHPERDVIEVPISDELDIVGWDVKKAMELAAKGNVVVHEWLNTPIVYQSNQSLYEKLMKVMDLSFKPQAAYYHYRAMSKSAWKDIKGQDEVKFRDLEDVSTFQKVLFSHAVFSFAHLFKTPKNKGVYYKNYSPPNLIADIIVSNQVFLI